MLEGSISFTLSGATELKKLGFGSLTIGTINLVCTGLNIKKKLHKPIGLVTVTLSSPEIIFLALILMTDLFK